MRAAKHAPRGRCRFLEHRDGLTVIVERGTAVFIADGMSLPYGHLIDWPQARLSLPESLAKNFSAVVETVAAVSKGRKARMRSKVRLIYNECMATDARLADCFLRDLALAVRAPHREAALKAAESLRGPDCPSHDLDVAGDNPRYGWSVG